MVHLRKVRDSLTCSYALDLINDMEFALLYDLNRSQNPDIPHWKYGRFDLENLTEDECKTDFRFLLNDIYELVDTLNLPEEILCYNNVRVNSTEALCMLLKRFSYPCRYTDMIPMFGRPAPQLSIIVNNVTSFLYRRWSHLLFTMNQVWLSPQNLESFSNKVQEKGAALNNCWGFVDGTVRPVCRPGHNQRILYNGHKKVHAIKFQSVVAPNGLIANLYGPVEGRRHDSGMLAMSGLLPKLQQHSIDTNGNILWIYGDPAYPLRPQLLGPYKGANITNDQALWNQSMSEAPISVEWIFGDIINNFKFLDFKKNLKVQLSFVGKMYIVASLLHNARAILYGTTTRKYFDIDPPALTDYFQ